MIGAGGKPPRGGLLVLVVGSSGESGEGVIRAEGLQRDPGLLVYLSGLPASEACSTLLSPKGGAPGEGEERAGKRLVPDTLGRC